VQEQTRCEGVDCGDNASGDRFNGKCDKNGCDFQTYRLGNTTFFGSGSSFALDTTKPMSVVTQFITADGTDSGALKEIRRFYKQGSKIVQTPTVHVGSGGSFNSISQEYCTAENSLFNDGTNFLQKGGMSSMDDAMEKGVVLVMSIWDDHDVNMLWLDSTYPTSGDKPGDARGTCATTSGVPATVEKQHADAKVTYSNIRFGEIGSTTSAGPAPSPSPSPTPSPTPSGCPGGSLSACIHVCPSTPASVYAACVSECVSRCSPSEVVEATTRTVADKWGLCSVTAHCPTGWECASRANGAFHQCVPSKPLVSAFAATKPAAEEINAFVSTGATVFGRALPKA